MKEITMISIFAFVLLGCQSMGSIGKSYTGVTNEKPLETGTYYIVNNGLAMTPTDAMPGQNVFLNNFIKSGLQKWKVTKKVSGKSINYTIRLAGDVDGLWFQTYAVKDHTPVIGSSAGSIITFKITPVAGKNTKWLIKCNRYNGDALHSYVFSKELSTEMRFDPYEDGNTKFMWEFVNAEE